MINSLNGALDQQSYQAPYAVSDGSDHDNIERNLDGSDTPAYIANVVNLPKYYSYLAIVEAVRHYDYWPDATRTWRTISSRITDPKTTTWQAVDPAVGRGRTRGGRRGTRATTWSTMRSFPRAPPAGTRIPIRALA